MDIDGIIQEITMFAQDNIVVAAIVGLFSLFLLIRHPKVLLIVIVIVALAFGLAELFDYLRIITKW